MPKAAHANTAATYVVVATCVVLRRNRHGAIQALLLKRSDTEKEGPGLWTIPGGKIERKDWGKSVPSTHTTGKAWVGVLNRAIKREIKEETGLRVRRVAFIPGREKVFMRKDGTPALVVVFCAACATRSTVRHGKDSTQYAWVSPEDLKHYACIGNVRGDILFACKAHPA